MNDFIDNYESISKSQVRIPESKLKRGSLRGKIEVVLDERTTIYVKPGKDIESIKEKYLKHMRKYQS